MAEEVTIDFKSKRVQRFIAQLDKNFKAADKRQKGFVTALSAIVFNDVQDHFKKEEGPSGKWADYSETTMGAIQGEFYFRHVQGKTMFFLGEDPNGRYKKGSAGEMLVNSGTMRNWFAPAQFGGRSRKVTNGIQWFNRAKTKGGFAYAAHHDTGPSDSKGNPRPFMWLSGRAMDKIAGASLEFLTKGTNV